LDGKFFRLGEKKFYVKGVTYGPFSPNLAGESFPTPEQTALDFESIRKLGANVVRVYYAPPRWVLDLALEHELKLLIDVPWSKYFCFLDSSRLREESRQAVISAVRGCGGHPAVFAFSVVNEIPPDVVRWTGTSQVEEFLDELVELAKSVDSECLCTIANYPPTEFLRCKNIDFYCFNVYLHQQRPFENYLARLQMIADSKPIILGEFGVDSISEGEPHKCDLLGWQIESSFRSGLAGVVIFSYTDDWYKDNRQITDWAFGLTTRDRQPKPSYAVVQEKFAIAPYFPLPATPKVSVVVASYNGAKTLKTCLESLVRLNYPYYEVILIDDGSTDITPEIASFYKTVRYFHQLNQGLSVARNSGVFAAEGEIVAFTDSDCRADEDWLYYLVGDLLKSKFTGIGGHNFLPPEDSLIAAAVLASPGGPAHVMLTDRLAEHIPGCNMAFYKWALMEIGCFDPLYRKAGDDVDICWRLQQRGYKIGFSPAGFVWHYRRSTVHAYLKQQSGYGQAEALLVRRHPEYFNSVGGSIWHGRIYTASKFGVVLRPSIVYHGIFASGFFQTLYSPEPAFALMLCTSLEYHVLISLPLLVLSVPFPYLFPLALTSVCIPLAICIAAAVQADIPKLRRRIWSRPLVGLLFYLQPVWRGWARYKSRLQFRPTPLAASENYELLTRKDKRDFQDVIEYWSDTWFDRLEFVQFIFARLEQQGWQTKTDAGWSEFDVEVYGSRWSRLQLTTVGEPHSAGRILLRCRLKTFWSLPAKVAFFSVTGFLLLVIGIVGGALPWLWMLLLLLPLFAWFLEQEQRDLKRLITLLLDEAAGQRTLLKLPASRLDKQGNPKTAPVVPSSV